MLRHGVHIVSSRCVRLSDMFSWNWQSGEVTSTLILSSHEISTRLHRTRVEEDVKERDKIGDTPRCPHDLHQAGTLLSVPPCSPQCTVSRPKNPRDSFFRS